VAAAPVAVPGKAAKAPDAGADRPAAKPDRKKQTAAGGDSAQPAGAPAPLPLSPASSGGSDDGGDDGVPAWLIVIAVVALASAAIWGGWVLYRRGLPASPGGPGH
jgi:hypothetical protein